MLCIIWACSTLLWCHPALRHSAGHTVCPLLAFSFTNPLNQFHLHVSPPYVWGKRMISEWKEGKKKRKKENGQDVHWNGRATNILISGESTSVGIVVLRCKWIERGMWLVWSEMDSVSLNETQCGIVGNFGGGGFNVDVWWNTDVVLLFFSHASWSALLSSPRIWIGLNGKWHSPSFAPVYIYAWGCIKIIT